MFSRIRTLISVAAILSGCQIAEAAFISGGSVLDEFGETLRGGGGDPVPNR